MRVDMHGHASIEEARAVVEELFPDFAVELMLKADVGAGEPFEEWFLRVLEEHTNEHFVSAQLAIWETLDDLLRAHGVITPDQMSAWELNRALFDLRTASTARMVGFHVPDEIVRRLAAMGFPQQAQLDFPAIAYRMGLLYSRLAAEEPVAYPELIKLARSFPLTEAEKVAIDVARHRAGIWLQPVFDSTGHVWTADREIEPLRQILGSDLEARRASRFAIQNLSRSQRAQGVIRDARRVVRTEIAEARTRGAWAMDSKRWTADTLLFRQTAGNPCKGCLFLSKNADGTPKLYTRAQVEAADALGVNRGSWPNWHVRIAGNHPNCFPGETLIETGKVPRRGFERFYRGELVVFETEAGHHLAGTPNHPILTDRGDVAAGLLHVGSYVVSGRWRNGMCGGRVDGQNAPARIEDVVRALGLSREVAPRPVPTTAEDFHGDGKGSQVAIVRTDGLLTNDSDTSVAQQAGQLLFMFAWWRRVLLTGQRAPAQFIQRALYSPNRCMSCGGIRPALLRRQIFLSQFSNLMFRAKANARFHETELNGALDSPEIPGELLDRSASHVPGSKFSIGEGEGTRAQLVGSGNGAPSYASSNHPLADDAVRSTQSLADHPGALARLITSGDLVDVQLHRVHSHRHISFAGPVFNVSTPENYYTAGGLIVHNCRDSPWAEWIPAMASIFATRAPAYAEQMKRLHVLEEAAAA